MSVTGMLKTMVPISRFNKGEANKIFDEVETPGRKILLKTGRRSRWCRNLALPRVNWMLWTWNWNRSMVYEMDSRIHQRGTEGFAEVRSICAETGFESHWQDDGKPLGNHASSRLSGFYKIKLKNLGYRVVYDLVREGSVMKIIIISVRDDEAVYKEAERRIQGLIKPME